MQRRNFLKSSLSVAVVGSTLASCGTSVKKTEEEEPVKNDTFMPGDIVHTVYFWLKEDITEEEETEFLKFFELLKKVPTVKTFHFGKPAPTTPRPVVDNSFSYSIIVTFANMDDINVYETHSIHLDAIDLYKKYWTKVLVTDITL